MVGFCCYFLLFYLQHKKKLCNIDSQKLLTLNSERRSVTQMSDLGLLVLAILIEHELAGPVLIWIPLVSKFEQFIR